MPRLTARSSATSDSSAFKERKPSVFRNALGSITGKAKTSATSSTHSSSESFTTDSTQNEIIIAMETGDVEALEKLLRKNPQVALSSYTLNSRKDTQETLLSYAILSRASLPLVETIYNTHPDTITKGNNHGMSALHQASTVATSLEMMKFLVNAVKTRDNMSVAQLVAPGNWTVMHVACRCGVLPNNTFQYLLGQARTTLALKTEDKGSTPLHLAIFGLSARSPADQRFILQHMVQSYPYAVNTANMAGYTPVDLAQHQAKKSHFPNDMVGLLLDVQVLVRRKFGTRVQVERAIERCQTKLDRMASSSQLATPDAASNTQGSSGTGGARISSADKKATLRQGMLAHIEMQMLLPLRKRFMSEADLRELVAEKTKERTRLSQMGPQYLAQTIALNEELITLEAKIQREIDALVPQEIQATRRSLQERLQAETHILPINNVSLQFLKMCTDNFSEANQIGKGGFGQVYRAYDPASCIQCAVKKTDKTDDPSLLREVEVLAHVFHPNVIRLLGFYVPPEGTAPEFLVYEYAAGGTLADRVSSEENRKSLTWNIRLSAAAGIASGLQYLHHGMEHRILHHDIKPENIVFTETLDRAILIDCGISKVLKGTNNSFKKTMAGTPFYLPDDYNEDTPYDEKCEVFSFGMVLRVLLSGKLPKSLRDRTAKLEPDPLAGTWPPGVLDRLMEEAQACVSPDANHRPTVEQLYRDLMQLEAKAEADMILSENQEAVINETLAESRQISRASRKLEAFGKCFCSRHKKQGLYCPGKLHFQCSECFNKFVLDFLGEDIYCRERCPCRDPYTLDELHHHLRRSVLCRHVEAVMRHRELSVYKMANNRIIGEIGRGFDRVMVGITTLARDELRCPLLALLIPARSDQKRSVLRRAMRSWKASTQKTFFLYFLCAHDRSLVQAPIKVNATKGWVKATAPFFRAVLVGLQVAVMVAGLPISIPMIPDPERGVGSLTDNLEVLDEMLMDISGSDGSMDRDMQALLDAMQNGTGQQRLSQESYCMVADLANQPGNMGWKERMVLAERRGELAWVRRENEEKWKRAKG